MDTDFSHLAVKFFLDTRQNKRKSEEEGRPIFDDVEMVEIRIAGDQKTVFVAPAHDQSSSYDRATGHRMTYAELHPGPYQAFKAGQEFIGSGTPLDQAPFVTPAKVSELKAFNVHTVEQLAELDGELLGRLGMGSRALKGQAVDYLEQASGVADVGKLASENADLKERLAALESMMAAGPSTGPQQEPEKASEVTPFDDWDKETLKLWFEEQGGSVDGRWSLERLREEANDLNAKLAKAA